jgi:2'-hydroxyisoflavone reductase
MQLDRREFLTTSLAGSAALALGCQSAAEKQPAPTKQLSILILGGTGFLGPALVEVCRAKGHKITLFNRGKTRPGLFPDLEKLTGDRDPNKGEGIRALEGRKFDAVFDDCGYYPRHVKASCELMANNVGQYVYVSSISCYARNDIENANEDSELATISDPTVETMGAQYENYGALKALCEQAAEAAMPGRVTVIRPGYIVGPEDPTDRFTYWPMRVDQGGDVLVPGNATDPIQVIDVRDLAAFMLKTVEDRSLGRFNACGPDKRMQWGQVLKACEAVATKPAKLHWVPVSELAGFPGLNLPIWAPYEGESKGFHTVSNARAMAKGLRFRSIEDTVRDTRAWFLTLPPERQSKLRAGLSAEKEREVLIALKRITG